MSENNSCSVHCDCQHTVIVGFLTDNYFIIANEKTFMAFNLASWQIWNIKLLTEIYH